MYGIRRTSLYKRGLKAFRKRGYDMKLLDDVVSALANGKQLDQKHRDHPLTGNYAGFRECHITSDWLLIYKIEAGVLVLVLHRIWNA